MTDPADEPILELQGVSKRFGATVVARALNLAVGRGEFFTFLGPSGSGKSTILRMIAGLESPDDGRIRLDGQDVAGVPPWRRNLGMMFQQYAIFPHMTVEENVAYGLRVRRMGRSEVSARVERMLALVGLTGMEKKNATLLSGGEQQRVALARALAPEPRMLLLDEPLSALDEKIRRAMQGELKDVHRRTGTTFLYVTHDQEEALTMSDRIAVFNQGSCVQCDTPERLYRHPRTRFVAEFFRGCNVLHAETCGESGLALAGLKVPLSGVRRAEKGTTVHLALRAESVKLDEPTNPQKLQLPARLVSCTFRGMLFDHVLELADGQQLTASTMQRASCRPEEVTRAQIDPADLLPLEE
jgi:ABC-type Fe3+/spermidine/putrescine transport system ATPase subunit